MKKQSLFVASVVLAGSASLSMADIPLINATCPGGIEVHADQGGPVFVNGKQATLKAFNKNYYEAKGGGVTISLSMNPDGSPSISYTGPKGANGVCQLAANSGSSASSGPASSGTAGSPAPSSQVISAGNMPAYCRGEVSGMYGTKPAYVKTGKIVKAKDSSLSISGTVDQGSNGIKKFMCRFDKQGRFIDVMAMTSDGE